MIVLMHYAADRGHRGARPDATCVAAIATGEHLTTLAFSEFGSRSHFWSPTGTATPVDDGTVRLDAQKSWVTSAGHADSYVWSSRPLAGDGPMTLWLVPADAAGLSVAGGFDGLGLRGNGSRPMTAEDVRVPAARDARRRRRRPGHRARRRAPLVPRPQRRVLPRPRRKRGRPRPDGTSPRPRLRHTGAALRDAPVVRRDFARLRIRTDALRAFLADTLAALETGRDDAMLRVLEIKALAGRDRRRRDRRRDAAVRRQRLPQGAGPRAPLPRRTRGAGDGADHRRAARLRRPGLHRPAAARRGEPLTLAPPCCWARSRTTRRSSRSGTGFRAWLRRARPGLRLRPVLALRTAGRGPRRRAHRRRLELAAGLAAGRAAGGAPPARPCAALAMRDTDRDLTSVVVVRADSPVRRARRPRAAGSSRVGAVDSPQATLIPLAHLAAAGVDGRRTPLRRGRRPARRPHRRRAGRGPRAGGRRGRRRLHDRRQPSGVRRRRARCRRTAPGSSRRPRATTTAT